MGRLKPDVLVLRAGRATAVIDAKYKRLPAGAYRNADLERAELSGPFAAGKTATGVR